MSEIGDIFDSWAAEGRHTDMESRHMHTAAEALAAMPIEPGATVLDLGTGSGYAARVLAERATGVHVVGLDAAAAMATAAADADPAISPLVARFERLPLATDSIDHCWSMEAFYYSTEPRETLAALHRVLRPGGTFHCAVNFYAENTYSHGWPDRVGLPMTLWSAAEYRAAFRAAGFAVATQRQIPDRIVEIPPADAFPTAGFETRTQMHERYRELGTLLTVGVAR
jgi:ubiquinone/menaquinone biosynthesis C-methylase UbiE